MRIVWSPLAVERLTEIVEYIAQDNPKAAESWIQRIFQRVDQLKSFPESGRNIPETNNPKIRELFYGNYRIIYRIEENQLSILTVRHGKQILPKDESN